MRKFLTVLAVASMGTMSFAEKSTMRQEEAHEHGAALLNVALDQQQLSIELESPAFNIVGFEHRPSNPEQEEAIHNAEEKLRNAEQLFGLPKDAACQLADVEVEWSLDDEHHDEDEQSEETHSEFLVHYEFQCESADNLTEIEVALFSHFPNFGEIDVQLIGPNGQAAVELTATSNRIKLGS